MLNYNPLPITRIPSKPYKINSEKKMNKINYSYITSYDMQPQLISGVGGPKDEERLESGKSFKREVQYFGVFVICCLLIHNM